jgi:hypothetical protein
MLNFVAIIFVVLAGLETFIAGSVYWLRQGCRWLITPLDLHPRIEKKGLARFIEHGWDSHLGWVRKPDTSGQEDGKDGEPCRYYINSIGARANPGYDNHSPRILVYGDSYAFARQVNDDQTWAHQLSTLLDVNTVNKGVGNYGLDQALLRLEREFDNYPAPVVLMAVVPETISRVLSTWRHFSEYGNTFAFKPRFIFNGEQLELLPNPMDRPEKFFNIPGLLDDLKTSDEFYRRKFLPDLLRFPYLWHLWRSRGRNLPLMAAALADRLGGHGKRAFCRVMDRNINLATALYQESAPVDLLVAIIERFTAFVRSKGATPVFVMLPQLFDLKHLRVGDHYYVPLLDRIEKALMTIDLGPFFMAQEDDGANYIDDHFGGHLSIKGNRLAAEQLADVLEQILNNEESPWLSRGDML